MVRVRNNMGLFGDNTKKAREKAFKEISKEKMMRERLESEQATRQAKK